MLLGNTRLTLMEGCVSAPACRSGFVCVSVYINLKLCVCVCVEQLCKQNPIIMSIQELFEVDKFTWM